MELKEIKELIKLINESNISEFNMKDGDFKVKIRTDKYVSNKGQVTQITSAPAAVQAPVTQAPAAAPAASKAEPKGGQSSDDAQEGNYLEVKSPIVGTFYRSPSPDKPPYVKVGDTINEGDTVCIVEAMKLFNEIETEVSGKVVKVMVEDGTPVEFDQVLFLVDPNA